MVKENDLKKYKLWQTRFARAKNTLQICNNLLKISKITNYKVVDNRWQVVSEPVYCIDAVFSTSNGNYNDTINVLMQLSHHLNAIAGLADGEHLQELINELKDSAELGQALADQAEIDQLNRPVSEPSSNNPYTFEEE